MPRKTITLPDIDISGIVRNGRTYWLKEDIIEWLFSVRDIAGAEGYSEAREFLDGVVRNLSSAKVFGSKRWL